MIRKPLTFVAAALFAASVAAPASALDAEAKAALSQAASSPSAAERIEADVVYLADDKREGRETGSQGYLDAANYVAARFEKLGLKPGVDGAWFQDVNFRGARRDMSAAQVELIGAGGERETLVHLEDYIIGRPMRAAAFDITAPAVFAGFGIVDEASGYDDYKDLDVDGKIVVVFGGAPAAFDSERRAYLGSGDRKDKLAAERGAVGMIAVRTIDAENRSPWKRAVSNPSALSMTWLEPNGAPHASPIDAGAYMSASGAAKLFDGAKKSFAAVKADAEKGKVAGFDLPGTVRLKGASVFEEATSPNVIGVIEGSDPVLKNEAVILTAHLDHIGVKPAKAGEDVINNGAIDNALGVATFLDVARAFREGAPPKRTIIIVALTGEEKGLLGADYFARYPATDGKRMVANVNLDMPMALFPFTDVIAFGAEHSTLGPLVEKAAAEMDVKLSPDPIPEEGIFTRSDHYRFVQQGVPSVYIMLGYENGGEAAFGDFLKNHYHQPSDQLSLPIDYEVAARFADLNYCIARAIADAGAAPAWNEGDYFGEIFGK